MEEPKEEAEETEGDTEEGESVDVGAEAADAEGIAEEPLFAADGVTGAPD